MADTNQQNEKEITTEELNHILQARRDKLAALQAEGNDPYQITKFDVTHHSQEIIENFETLETKEGQEPILVRIAGRLMSKRVMGKASFAISKIKKERFNLMSLEMRLEQMSMLPLRSWILETLLVLRERYLRQRQENAVFML